VALVGDGATRADRQPVSLNAGLNRGVRATAKRNRTVAALSPFRQNATSEAYALRPKAHERARMVVIRCFGVSAFGVWGVSAARFLPGEIVRIRFR